MKKLKFDPRIDGVYLIFFLLFFILLLRIAGLQFFCSRELSALARSQHNKVVSLEGARGEILDRNMRVLATNITVYSVYADPHMVSDRARASQELACILGLEVDDVRAKLTRGSHFVWIKRMVPYEEKNRIEALGLEGVGFVREKKRLYPQGQLLAHILGGVDIDSRGIEGVELFYDKYLRGKRGLVSVSQDASSRFLFLYPQIFEPKNGLNIVLTIDAQIQYWVEKLLQETIEHYHAKAGSVVVVDAANGDIISLANFPSFDPGCLGSFPEDYRRNRAVTDVFEPGSVFKIVTLVASCDQKYFKMDDVFFCENGIMNIPGSVLHDWHPYGELTFKEVFKKSSNIGVAKIATSLGPQLLYSYIRRLGFGEKTGIDLPGEVCGLVKPLEAWSRTSPYIIPIGQEVGVTVVQLARALSSIVNGGNLIRPRVVKRAVGDYGFRDEIIFQEETILPKETAAAARGILVEVVDDGTAKRAQVKGIVAGGKTGTAQKFDVKLGKYSPWAYRASFAGFIQQDEHVFVICVSIDEPRQSHFGGVVAAPLFQKIAQKIVQYMGTNSEEKLPL